MPLRLLASKELCREQVFMGKGFLVHTQACLGTMWQKNWQHVITKSIYSLKTFGKCLWWLAAVLYEIIFQSHSLNENTSSFFDIEMQQARTIHDSRPSVVPLSQAQNLRNDHKRNNIPLGILLVCLIVILCFKVLLWMGTIAPWFTFIALPHNIMQFPFTLSDFLH